ncbi:MAG: choice-of-anchor J domain-containing protein [Prevotella sp.]|nr:choice-of-anchor J domain-containing protein [Prevotella sp.]
MKKILSLMLVAGGVMLASTASAQLVKRTHPVGEPDAAVLQQLHEQATTQQGHRKASGAQQKTVLKKTTTKVPVLKEAQPARRAPRRATSETFTPNPTWSVSFDSQADFDLFTVIDANGDQPAEGYHYNFWEYSSNGTANISVTNASDDWLITPGLNLTGGKQYTLTFKTWGFGSWAAHKLGVYYGTAATVAGMTETINAQIDVVETSAAPYEGNFTFTPATSGVYYIGFHEFSDASKYNLYLDDIVVETELSQAVPAAVTDVVVTPGEEGALKATITFKAPTLSAAGDPLDETTLSGAKIYSNDELVAEVKRLTPGGTGTFVDNEIPEPGLYSYKVVAYNDEGDGDAAEASAWIGLDIPTVPANRLLTDNVNSLSFTWDASEAAHGGYFKPEDVTYDIFDIIVYAGSAYLNGQLAQLKGETGVEFDVQVDSGEQQYKYLGIRASNESGTSGAYLSQNAVFLGAPYQLPFNEGFAGEEFHSLWFDYVDPDGFGSYYNPSAGIYTSTDDSDGDGTSLYLQTVYYDYVELTSGKISLAGAAKPTLVFQQKNEATEGTFYVYAVKPDGTGVRFVTEDLAESSEEGWQTRMVDLSSLAGERWAQIGFALEDYEGYGYQRVHIDNINVVDLVDNDVNVQLTATPTAAKGDEVAINVQVNNHGTQDVESFKLKVTAGDDVVADYTVADKIPAFGYKKVNLTYTTSKLLEGNELAITAEVTVADDVDTDNNVAEATIALTDNDANPVGNLTATVDADNEPAIQLAWEAPSLNKLYTDNFESYADWATSFGNWTTYDGDGSSIYGPEDYLEFTGEGSSFAFNIFSPANYDGFDLLYYGYDEYLPHSGQKCLGSYYGVDASNNYVDNDDWVISPELNGEAQTISFYAKNYYYATSTNVYTYPETIEVLASSTTNDPSAFTIIGSQITLATEGEWKEITADLPEGTKYFAIRNVTGADDAFLLLIDDVSYYVDGEQVESYNVYRDGQLIAQVTNTEFNDTDAEAGDHTYQVTAVYADGTESPAVAATVNTTGIQSAIVKGQPFDVYTLDGRLVRRQTQSVSGLRGAYIINNKKVILK